MLTSVLIAAAAMISPADKLTLGMSALQSQLQQAYLRIKALEEQVEFLTEARAVVEQQAKEDRRTYIEKTRKLEEALMAQKETCDKLLPDNNFHGVCRIWLAIRAE